MKLRHVLAVLALFAAVDSHAALIHRYELNGSLKDQLGGPDLVANGGSLKAQGYAFQPNQGLQLREDLGADYTIDMVFHLDTLGSWRKIVDFSDLKKDIGFYASGSAFSLYDYGGSAGKIAAKQDVRLTLSRTADAILNVYQDGKLVVALNDSKHYADFTGHYANFFRDDNNGGEATAGAVGFIHVYDNALNAAEVRQLLQASQVAEPASALLVLCGIGMLGIARRRRLA
jgi:hypothetical protein